MRIQTRAEHEETREKRHEREKVSALPLFMQHRQQIQSRVRRDRTRSQVHWLQQEVRLLKERALTSKGELEENEKEINALKERLSQAQATVKTEPRDEGERQAQEEESVKYPQWNSLCKKIVENDYNCLHATGMDLAHLHGLLKRVEPHMSDLNTRGTDRVRKANFTERMPYLQQIILALMWMFNYR